jgi:hypothetical protein
MRLAVKNAIKESLPSSSEGARYSLIALLPTEPISTRRRLKMGDDSRAAVPRAPAHFVLLSAALTTLERDRFFLALFPIDACLAADFFD